MEEMIEIPDKLFFRPDEAAKLIGVHIETIRRWIREGKIQSTKTQGGHNRIHISQILQKRPAIPSKL
ncbi:MAG: excisionase family DNA-binding protein [Nitrospirae bacterium]|nr:excisionase family DNA-binding protein [Nitrospirota bacterium]